MEGSSSDTTKNGQNFSDKVDSCNDCVLSLGRFVVEKDGILRPGVPASQTQGSNGGSSSSLVPSLPTPEQDVAHDDHHAQQVDRIESLVSDILKLLLDDDMDSLYPCRGVDFVSDKNPENIVEGRECYEIAGSGYGSYISAAGSSNRESRTNNFHGSSSWASAPCGLYGYSLWSYEPVSMPKVNQESFLERMERCKRNNYVGSGFRSISSVVAESSNRESKTNFFHGSSSIAPSPYGHYGNYIWNDEPVSMPIRLNELDCHQFGQIGGNRAYSSTDVYETSSSVSGNENENGFLMIGGGTHGDEIKNFQSKFKSGDHNQRERILSMFRGSMVSLMVDERKYLLFRDIIVYCSNGQLHSVIEEVLSKHVMLVDAAFCKPGAISLKNLISKLTDNHHTFTMTSILSLRFFDIMIHPIAKSVILHCLNVLGHEPNEILYEQAIRYSLDLATYKTGCRSLNDCLVTVAGDQRGRLLDRIASISDILAHDLYGTYVVQKVLTLESETSGGVKAEILWRLKGHFVSLAKKKEGSHIVEKCMEFSDLGTACVVQEILECPSAAFRLAIHEFGNYVIQKALKRTKRRGLTVLYTSIIEALEPYHRVLNRATSGKHVINLCNDDILELKMRRSICGTGFYCHHLAVHGI